MRCVPGQNNNSPEKDTAQRHQQYISVVHVRYFVANYALEFVTVELLQKS
ncbi:unnamed protein product [marine sediment metagenome]|uniref:Uncharacterized protein n=1 Tax=marine sediment metagenome TaxID=412755 RepID=X1RIG6_9ZZZZ